MSAAPPTAWRSILGLSVVACLAPVGLALVADQPLAGGLMVAAFFLVAGGLGALVSNQPMLLLLQALPFLFIPAIPLTFRIWGVAVIAAFLTLHVRDHRDTPLATGQQVHLVAIAILAILGFLNSSRSLHALEKLLGSYLLPMFIYAMIVKTPRHIKIEESLPRLYLIAFSIIGLGSVIFKIMNPYEQRVSGFFYITPTLLAYAGSALITISLFYVRDSPKRILEWALFSLLMMAILLTNTRMAIIMTAAAFLVNHRHFAKYTIPIIVVSGSIALVGLDVFFQRFTHISHTSFDTSIAARLVAWDTGLRMVAAHPWTGIGLSSFSELYLSATRFPIIQLVHAHNSFLQKAADIGIPGMLVFFAFIGSRLWAGFRDGGEGLGRALAWGLFIYLGSTLSDSIFYRTDYSLFFWSLLACLERFTLRRTLPHGQTATP